MEKIYKITDEELAKAKNLIRENGGTIYKDGNFEVKGVEGHFRRLEEGRMKITITDKPWLASWRMIEDKLDEFFN